MSLGGKENENRVAQFWTLAQRARASMRFGLEREALPGLIEDLIDIAAETPIQAIRPRARAVVAEYRRMLDAEPMAFTAGDIA